MDGHTLGDVIGAAFLVLVTGWKLVERYLPAGRRSAETNGKMDHFIERLTMLTERHDAQQAEIDRKADIALSDHRVIIAKIDGVAADVRGLR